ncbi:hypothetical protein TNCT_364991, partial [Trichonephila clavata]
VIEQRDVQIVIWLDFWLEHLTAAKVAKVNKAFGVGTTSELTAHRLFAKFRNDDMEIDHKSGAVRPVRCNVNHLRESRVPINVNGTTVRIRTLFSNTVNLLTFGGNRLGEKA